MAVVGSSAALGACVLIDPPNTLPIVNDPAPAILTSSVEPPEGVLVKWPEEFYIPVSVLDPAQSVQWEAFEDYTSLLTISGDLPVPGNGLVEPGDGGVQYVRITDLATPLGPGCHRVAVVIAYGFSGPTQATPVSPGGAMVQWLYVPSGNPGECAGYDAGWLVDASFPPDVESDANSGKGGV